MILKTSLFFLSTFDWVVFCVTVLMGSLSTGGLIQKNTFVIFLTVYCTDLKNELLQNCFLFKKGSFLLLLYSQLCLVSVIVHNKEIESNRYFQRYIVIKKTHLIICFWLIDYTCNFVGNLDDFSFMPVHLYILLDFAVNLKCLKPIVGIWIL